MVDREKVIRGLHCCSRTDDDNCCNCPYDAMDSDCSALMSMDVLELLKEQEPVEPKVEVLNEIDHLYRCQKCHKCFFYEKQKYCDQCGQAVKWE